ncbi:prolyl oligopeptidase, partial [Auriscalpium vulgare]
TAAGATVAGPFKGHTNTVLSVAFSPDGQSIVSGSGDNTVRVWNAATGAMVAGPLEGHTGSVQSAVFSPDGQRIASGSADNTVRVWNAHGDALKEHIKDDSCFTDHSCIDENGWIYCGDNQLLMWIPPLHRQALHRPSNIWISTSEQETTLDLQNFVHGKDWAKCQAVASS